MYTPNVIAVKPDSPYKTVEDLVAAMKARPGAVTIATAGVGSSGYFFIEQLKVAAGVTYRHVPYAGGAPAVMAVVSGETEMVPQLSSRLRSCCGAANFARWPCRPRSR
jgi:tripartite-type tricarboxylate transporter receptor subunit TctC